MRPFNVADAKIAERACCKRLVIRRLRNMALLVALTLVVAAVSCGCRMSVRSTETRLKSELADAQGRCTQLKHELAAIKAKANQRRWQRQLTGDSKRWLGVVDSVLGSVPPDVWLNRVESSDQSSSVSVEGQAVSFDSLSELTSKLRSCPRLSEVRINSTRVSSVGDVPVVDFALLIKLKTPAGAASQTASPEQSEGVPQVKESG